MTTLKIDQSLLSIIIVNWNAGRQLADVISSIALYHEDLVAMVAIIDNASTDNSITQVEKLQNLPFRLQIVRNTNNRGFAAACNQGAALASSDYLLFLNPDTRLYENSLFEPLSFIASPENANIGICGIQLINETGQVDRSCARFPTPLIFLLQAIGLNKLPGLRQFSMHRVDWDHATTQTVDHVIGAFFLVSRSLFEQLQGFDERFFVYLEDLDFSRRAFLAGWSSVYLTSAQAFHAGGGTSKQIKAARLFYSIRSRLLYAFKHFSPAAASAVLAATFLIEPITRTAFLATRLSWQDILYTCQGYWMLLKALPSILHTVFR
jgi:GT2 family glycosyltransferase